MNDSMRKMFRQTVRLGDLVVIAFAWATQHGSDSREVSLLASKVVARLMRRSRKTSPPRPSVERLLMGESAGLLAAEGNCRRVIPLALRGREGR